MKAETPGALRVSTSSMSIKFNAEVALPLTLSLAVPLGIETLKEKPWKEIEAQLPKWSLSIAEHGDKILFTSKTPGETAEYFAELAEAIAALSFFPGGVTVFGQHWESHHPEQVKPDDDQATKSGATND